MKEFSRIHALTKIFMNINQSKPIKRWGLCLFEITPYDRVINILSGDKDKVDRVPCVNSVSTATVNFMQVFGASWPNAHREPEKMAKLASAAHKLCGLDNITLPFDMTVEAEILGAPIEFFERQLKWPTVKRFLAEDISDLVIPKDVSTAGRIPVVVEAIKILKKSFDAKVPINVYINPPFTSISSYLVDTITFLKWLRKSPNKVHELCEDTLDVFKDIIKIYEDAGADMITFHEMGGSTDNISPKHFEEFVKPYLKELISATRVPTILNICGSAELIVDKMVECGAQAIAIDERTPIKKTREIVNKSHLGYPIIGNIPSYGVLFQGPVKRIMESVRNVIAEGVDMVAPGCDFWIETPTEHIKAFVEATIKFGTPPPWKKES